MFSLTPAEIILIIVAIAILLIWGPSKIPGLARAIGQAVYEFKRSVRGLSESEEEKKLDKDKIYELAQKLGIPTEGKSVEQLIDEVNKKLNELKQELGSTSSSSSGAH